MSGGTRAPAEMHANRLPGRVERRLGARRVTEIQRVRLTGAMGEVCVERGVLNVTVAHIVERAGVSRRTFYEIFGDRDDCFQAAFGEAIGRAEQYLARAYEPSANWAERIRDGLESLLHFLEDEPVMGRLLVVESLSAGPQTIRRRKDLLALVVAAIDDARHEAGASQTTATALTAEGVVGGVATVVHDRMLAGEGGFVELINPLMSMIVLPYLGPTAAREELERSVSEPAPRVAPAKLNPLKGLDMRLTYRTMRVLGVVASQPRSSNRLIGDASGINDQGQISKLLGRLEKLGLIENEGADGSTRGEPNAWTLTTRGEEVHDAVAGTESDG